MKTAAYIAINLFLLFSWYTFLFKERGYLIFADRLLGTFILGLTQIIATEMLLGVLFKNLFPVPLFILNLGISSGLLLFVMPKTDVKGLLNEIKEKASWLVRTITADRFLLCIFSLFFLLLTWLIFLGYLFPSYAWDALYYHLPTVGQIVQSGAIQENPTPSFIQQYINLFGKNINLFFLWNIIFLDSDAIVDLSQLIFALAGVICIYSIAVKCKIKKRHALYSSLLFFFTPVQVLQSTVNYIDVAVSVLFLISVNFLLYNDIESYTENTSSKNSNFPIILSGLAAGILLGSKPTGPLFLAMLACAIMLQETVKCFIPRNKSFSLKESFKVYTFSFAMPVILTGGYWYIKNWIYYGNPVYYVDVSIFNMTLFKGLKNDWVEPAPDIIGNLGYLMRLLHVWLEKVEYYLYDSRESGFGPLWFIFYLPCILFSVVYSIMKKNYRFLFVGLILIGTFLIHPRNWNARYVIFIVGLGALSSGKVFDHFHEKETALKTIALLLSLYTFLTVNSPCITPDKIREFLSLPARERTLTKLKPFNIDSKVRDEYGYWMWIEKNISKGDTLAYTFETTVLDTSRPFFTSPLWNRAFSSKVVYVRSASYNKWIETLERNNASYVLIKTGSAEDRWLEMAKKISRLVIRENFQVVYSDNNYRILKFIKKP